MASRSYPSSAFARRVALVLGPLALGFDGCGSTSSSLGALCGGTSGILCDASTYCDYAAVGASPPDGTGRCARRPSACTLEYAPVCGLDGVTYSNRCFAALNGASVAHGGACEASSSCPAPAPATPSSVCPDGTIAGPVCVCIDSTCEWTIRRCDASFCGGIAGTPCPSGEYCVFAAEARCGAADASGTCAVIPSVCTEEYAPVCGCDGKTYSNPCFAAARGVSVAAPGACSTDPACAADRCGPGPFGPFPYECVLDGNGACVWQIACAPPSCAAPPPSCHYENATYCTCGTLVCDSP